MTESRPPIESIATGAELRRWYWLKRELEEEARRVGVKVSGAKFTILDRLAHHRDTGELVFPGETNVPRRTSTFDWKTDELDDDTVITDSYRNTQNVRRYFTERVGSGFRFSIGLMEWIDNNHGRTLGDAVDTYRALADDRASGKKPTIKAHNQFNQYTRDFLADNPELGMDDVRRVWARKRAQPSDNGRHVYERSDLDLTGARLSAGE